jgi:chromosome segregation protein
MEDEKQMSTARLTALRLVGFKSFAERTLIEFGPGISAVVGPNGSGKSNLADALRWTLGEQGRQLRTRRAEDVIFAGSSSRKAIGMADVTLVIDNADRLLPVDYGEVEIGRRLYRSGENEYLLNRQRIRLRDLVELLDAGNLADNAFLFIGQGMVDQALALRPEERRPLFEEAAGVRRHERRRRQAEAELAEAESNLERLRDLLGELRPQARRLSAQAEQLRARRTAGLELAEALLASARSRWVTAAETEARESNALSAAHSAADAALSELHEAEESAATTSQQMASHADQERSRREVLEAHRAQIVELRVNQARIGSELAALARDSERLATERTALEVRLRDAALAMSTPVLQPDAALAAELEAVARSIGESGATADEAGADQGTSLERELAARREEHSARAQRARDTKSAAEASRLQLGKLRERLAEAEKERDAAISDLAAIIDREQKAHSALDDARERAQSTTAALAPLAEATSQLEGEAAAARSSLSALDSAIDATSDESLARAARARGGSLVAEGLEVDARFRTAVSAALDHAATAFAVDDAAPLLAAKRQGTLVVRGGTGRRRTLGSGPTGPIVAAAIQNGGGSLAEAIRRDPQSEVTRLLERVVWLPDMGAAFRLAPSLTPGWRIVTLGGDVLTDEGVIRLASERGVLDLRAERDALRRKATDLANQLAAGGDAIAQARADAEAAARDMETAQRDLDAARNERRTADERERVAQRRAEQWLREFTWESTQVERLESEAASAQELLQHTGAEVADLEGRVAGIEPSKKAQRDRLARLANLGKRHEELTGRREAEAARIATSQEERRVVEVRRAIDESRMAELDAQQAALTPRQGELLAEQSQLSSRLGAAELNEEQASRELSVVLAAGADDRTRLIEAEKRAADARERLRIAEQQTRKSEVAQMEARLQLEQLREGLLVELAGIGDDGLAALRHMAGIESDTASQTMDALNDEGLSQPDAFEATLDAVIEVWRAGGRAEATEPPSANKLGTLRRRFHDLGAGNPFAVEEYAELKDRLEAMEAQRIDLEAAITATRELIASLTSMITEQFRKTFAALEDAFARRFKELFGGGDAELSLTSPEDLSATGVEIHARPPGKKRQPLSMLSGGERALTAVSLLLAMLEVRPVPFCVLDEVDAALDEANIGRFSKALRGLSEQTQFIVITHNRGTIEGADALYGVTIGDDAVSRVISLRLPRPGGNGGGPRGVMADTTAEVEPVERSEATLA